MDVSECCGDRSAFGLLRERRNLIISGKFGCWAVLSDSKFCHLGGLPITPLLLVTFHWGELFVWMWLLSSGSVAGLFDFLWIACCSVEIAGAIHPCRLCPPVLCAPLCISPTIVIPPLASPVPVRFPLVALPVGPLFLLVCVVIILLPTFPVPLIVVIRRVRWESAKWLAEGDFNTG